MENLTIRRVCLHEVFKRADDKRVVPPSYSNDLLRLNERALAAFGSRVIAAFRRSAKCMEMHIANHGVGSVADLGRRVIELDDPGFLTASRGFADLLAGAQTSRQFPGGVVAVFDGTVGAPQKPFFAVMKAELQEGFLRQANLQATFVDSLFLSPKTRLYKIGLFVAKSLPPAEMPDGWTATVFDDQLTAADRDGAATYFHERFLGVVVPENSAHRTRQFFEKTREFISIATLDQDTKTDLYNSLYTYLKVDRAPTVQVSVFSERYVPEPVQAEYARFMERENFPLRAIEKDLSEVSARLRFRKLRFPRKIILTGPPEAMSDLVTIEGTVGPAGEAWTQIVVKGRIEGQE